MTVKCCFLCGEVITKDLEAHYQAEHMTQEQRNRKYPCATCEKGFLSPTIRNRHKEECLG